MKFVSSFPGVNSIHCILLAGCWETHYLNEACVTGTGKTEKTESKTSLERNDSQQPCLNPAFSALAGQMVFGSKVLVRLRSEITRPALLQTVM